MKSLNGRLDSAELNLVVELTIIRFKDYTKFKSAQSLIVWEQNLMEEEELFLLCKESTNVLLENIRMHYVTPDIVNALRNKDVVPLEVDTAKSIIHVGVVEEIDMQSTSHYKHYTLQKHYLPLYKYVKYYTSLYGDPDFLYKTPSKDMLEIIVEEAISLGASDITISNGEIKPNIYYTVKQRRVDSRRCISNESVKDMVKMIATSANSPIVESSRLPKSVSIDLNPNYRGRVELDRTYYGWSISIRVLKKENLNVSLEKLNLDTKTINFIRNSYLNLEEPGLRIILGATSSGKNTTSLAALNELNVTRNYKIVSIEEPVEQTVEGVEQIEVFSKEEYLANIRSVTRQNPSILFIGEMTALTAEPIIVVSNIGIPVYTTLHSNSIATSISRIQDLTGFTTDRIILNIHSIIHQKLVNIDGEVKPVTKCLKIKEELKIKLLGKKYDEIYSILAEEESKWD